MYIQLRIIFNIFFFLYLEVLDIAFGVYYFLWIITSFLFSHSTIWISNCSFNH